MVLYEHIYPLNGSDSFKVTCTVKALFWFINWTFSCMFQQCSKCKHGKLFLIVLHLIYGAMWQDESHKIRRQP